MRVRLNINKLWLLLLWIYPLVDVVYNSFAKSIHYSTFSIAYFSIVLTICIINRPRLITKRFLIIFFLFVIYLTLFYSRSGSVLLQFFIFSLFLLLYSDSQILDCINDFRKVHERQFFWGLLIYAAIIMYSVIFLNGLHTGWNTLVLYGPYSLPHTLAYELLTLITVCLLFYKENRKFYWLIVAGIIELMILLTCVRSAALASVIVFLSFTLSFDLSRKIYISIFVGLIIAVFGYLRVFDQIMEKTLFAIGNGSITNGREWIVNSTITIFQESSIPDKIFGVGYFKLLEGNLRLLGTAVQGHNDLLTILVSFGIIGFVQYCIGLIRYVKCESRILLTGFLLVLLVFNGLFLYMPMVIGLGQVKLFFSNKGNQPIEDERESVDGK